MELFERTASELSSMLRNKECSSVEITESVYNRIEKVEVLIIPTGNVSVQDASNLYKITPSLDGEGGRSPDGVI